MVISMHNVCDCMVYMSSQYMCDEIEIHPDNHYKTYNYILFNRYTICQTVRKQSLHEMNTCMHAIDDSNGISQFKYYMLGLFLFKTHA